jgi:hypothetical protein
VSVKYLAIGNQGFTLILSAGTLRKPSIITANVFGCISQEIGHFSRHREGGRSGVYYIERAVIQTSNPSLKLDTLDFKRLIINDHVDRKAIPDRTRELSLTIDHTPPSTSLDEKDSPLYVHDEELSGKG